MRDKARDRGQGRGPFGYARGDARQARKGDEG